MEDIVKRVLIVSGFILVLMAIFSAFVGIVGQAPLIKNTRDRTHVSFSVSDPVPIVVNSTAYDEVLFNKGFCFGYLKAARQSNRTVDCVVNGDSVQISEETREVKLK